MVAQIVRLKWQLLRNGLRRSVPQLIGLVLGGLYALGIVGLAVVGLVVLRFQDDVDIAAQVVTVLGSLATLGWAVVPLFAFGTDQTLDPARFATYAVPRRDLLLGMTAAAFIGIPGTVMTLLGLATVVTWSRSVLAAAVALVAAAVGVLTCVLLSRTLTTAATALSQSRRGREVASSLAVLLLIVLGTFGPQLGELFSRPDLFRDVANVLGWTPLGWAWSAPAQVAVGNPGTGLLRLFLATALLLGLLVLWERLLAMALQNPRAHSAAAGGRTVGLGWFARLPQTPAGAVAARSLTYYRRDPRYVVSLGLVPVLPLALLIAELQSGSGWWALAMAPLIGFLFGWGLHNDLAYDGTAFWMHVAAGVSGRADRLGRAVPLMVATAVLLPFYALLGAGIADRWDLLPATFGVGLGVLAAGTGVSFVVGAVKPYPVAQSGDNPFSTPPGAAGVTLVAQLIASSATFVLSLPVLITGVVAMIWHPWLGWVTLLLAVTTGAAYGVIGLRQGGRIYDRRAPELLADLSRIQ